MAKKNIASRKVCLIFFSDESRIRAPIVAPYMKGNNIVGIGSNPWPSVKKQIIEHARLAMKNIKS